MISNDSSQKHSWLDRPIFPNVSILTVELILFTLIIIFMAVSRLYDLGGRVMSHDESLHAYFSWLYSIGQGYQHTPTTHGPLQFHLIALTFLLLGDSDFTARLPHAIASIATVILLWKWRRYLGRAGTLITASLVLISPFMLYYGRYARNEVFVALLGVLTLYTILRYLETGKNRYLLLLTIATALHFTVKETAFIYTAQAFLFLCLYLVIRLMHSPWKKNSLLNGFVIGLSIGLLLFGVVIGLAIYNGINPFSGYIPAVTPLISLACISFIAAVIFLVVGYGWKTLRAERSFPMLILLGTFVLPQLTPIPVKVLGWNPLDYQFTWPGWNFQALWSQGPVKTAVVLFVLILLSISLGLLWDWKRWLINAAIFWGIYVFFYTSVFTNWAGLATGVVGSLGYWLAQQGVQRGNQPWYYYLLIQIPLYEFLPATGLGLAAYFGFRRKTPAPLPQDPRTMFEPAPTTFSGPTPTFYLLFCWAITSLVAFSIAGEKMPWLTVHITLPMILLTGWGLGQIIERLDWSKFGTKGVWATILLVTLFIAIASTFLSLFGVHPPLQGKTLEELTATGVFFFSITITIASTLGLFHILASWRIQDMIRLALLVFFSLLAIQTARTSIRATYLHPNDATEYLVYAHGASGIKDVMAQIETISTRTVGGRSLTIAYDSGSPDGDVAWPFNWYLRHYTNKTSFDQPGPNLQGVPVILVDQKNINLVNTIIGNAYYHIDYLRMVWPNQDYFNLNWGRIKGAIMDPSIRMALWEIWFNRNYSLYGKATGSTTITVPEWSPSDKMELLIRKDVAAEIWGYGILQTSVVQTDPYAKSKINLAADLTIGAPGSSEAQFNAPHGIAVAPDGSIYVADTNNNRIQHFTGEGKFINAWGSFSDVTAGNAPIGTFNQPWALAISPDGKYVYVADTWNHRIQKFTADGTPVKMWGKSLYDPLNNDPYGIWGPRGIAVDSQGRVFVADTGNKRILVFDSDGNFISQIGNEGLAVGQFEEPVGLVIDKQGNLYIADTWNQRVQVFSLNKDGVTYTPFLQWSVAGWYGESLDNKPYLAFDNQGHIFATDPESFRVLEFSTNGDFVGTWGDYGVDASSFSMPAGISADPNGHVWVSDSVNNRLVRFTLP
jgi:predicted membrane-bound mannosyltransferase/DNA-binding beta-propeller fold protein YncE